MVQSKGLRPDWLPAVALSAALAAAMLAWNPQVGDLAAQVFRTELFERGRPLDLERQLVRRPLHPHLQRPLPAARGAARSAAGRRYSRWSPPPTSSIASSATAGARRPAGRRSGSPPGVVTLLADGQLTFALGAAFGLASLRALQLGRPAARRSVAAAACALSSPVAARLPRPGVADRPGALAARAAARPCPAPPIWVGCPGPRPHRSSPTSSSRAPAQFPFAFSSYVAIPLWCGSALYLTRGLGAEERQLRLRPRSATCWLRPRSGWCRTRWAAMRFASGRCSAARSSGGGAARPPAPDAASGSWRSSMAGSLYWQLTASVAQIARSGRRPGDDRRLLPPPRQVAARATAPPACGSRCRPPPTTGRPPTSPPSVELARGWLRQLDTTRDDVFYEDGTLTDGDLRRLAARQCGPLRGAARRPARLLLGRGAAPDPRRALLPATGLALRTGGGSTR